MTSSSDPNYVLQGRITHVNGIDLWYETFGKKENPAVLLITGACCQGVLWDQIFCENLACEGFYVIRYDHRDEGASSCFDYEKDPYSLMDMTRDAVGILDAVGVKKAHLFGFSMGGFIAELMAAYFPERVYSLLLLGSTCEIHPMNVALVKLPPAKDSAFPFPSADYLEWLYNFMKQTPKTDEEQLEQSLEGWRRLNGHKVPLNEKTIREMHKAVLAKLRCPQASFNHFAMLQDPRSEALVRKVAASVKVPTVILQGSEDPIFPPGHGAALAKLIQHSEYQLVEGMGHIPNDHFYSLYIDILKRQAIPKEPQKLAIPTTPKPWESIDHKSNNIPNIVRLMIVDSRELSRRWKCQLLRFFGYKR